MKTLCSTDMNVWRRGWDSNPRLSFPNTRFPSVLLKPLGHLSVSIAIRLAYSECGPSCFCGVGAGNFDQSIPYCCCNNPKTITPVGVPTKTFPLAIIGVMNLLSEKLSRAPALLLLY